MDSNWIFLYLLSISFYSVFEFLNRGEFKSEESLLKYIVNKTMILSVLTVYLTFWTMNYAVINSNYIELFIYVILSLFLFLLLAMPFENAKFNSDMNLVEKYDFQKNVFSRN